MSQTLSSIAEDKRFQNLILGFILLAGVLAGLETSHGLMSSYGHLLHAIDKVVLAVFVVELVVKLGAVGWNPRRFFSDPWNVFDFTIVAVAFLPLEGGSVAVLRMARLLRFLRLVRALPRLQVLVGALLKSIPSMGYVGLLLAVLFYVYGILGVGFFGANDPFHFKDLPTAMLTLFGCATGEGWVDVMYIQMYGCVDYGYDGMEAMCTASSDQPLVGAGYFVSFMMLGAMVTLNLLVGVIMNGMEETAKENAELDAKARGEEVTVESELEEVHRQLTELTERLDLVRRVAAEKKAGG